MNRKIFFIYVIFFGGSFFIPLFSLANVEITEIMYDVSGSDTGREWVEIRADAETDISDWKLFEANTNHALTLVKGVALIPSSGFAVIADNTEKFLLDFPSFAGTLFDSSFSLSNTGETISLRDGDFADINIVSYSSDQGSAGDGNSLQKLNGVWTVGVPTPGAANSITDTDDVLSENTGTQTSFGQTSSTNTLWQVEPQVFADAGADRTVIVGADSFFEGKAYGAKHEPIIAARYVWNFGDGGEKEGQSVAYHYRYPGEYAAVLSISSGYYSGIDRIRVKAIPANIHIASTGTGGKQFIELINGSGRELDISWWRLRAGAGIFTIPKNTFILPDTHLIFPSEVTSLSTPISVTVALLYPNGEIATTSARFNTSDISYDSTTVPPARTIAYVAYAGTDAPQDTISMQNNTSTAVAPSVFGADISEKTQRDIVPLSVFTAAAAAGSSLGITDGAPVFKWILALCAVTSLAIAGVVFVKRKESALVSSAQKEAEGFEILED